MLDTVGLVSPVALAYYPLPADQLVTDNAIPARLIVDQQPDVVVTLDAFAQRSLAGRSGVSARVLARAVVPRPGLAESRSCWSFGGTPPGDVGRPREGIWLGTLAHGHAGE